MLIRISVIQFRGGAPLVNQVYIFDERGGSIGREEGNQLILRDDSRVLSRVQAQITFADDHFSLLDHGGNPSLVNSLRIGKGNSRPLYDGDIIELGEYKLRAKVIGGSDPTEALPTSVDNDTLDMSLHLEGEFDELSTIVPREPSLLQASPATPPRPSAPQLLAALCKGINLSGIHTLPDALDADSMQRLGSLLGDALRQSVDHLSAHNALHSANSAALQTLLLQSLQQECTKHQDDAPSAPPASH